MKYNRDVGQSLNRSGSQRVDPGRAVDRILDGLSDENLDLLRGKTGGFGLRGDLRRRKIGKHVIRSASERKNSVTQQSAGECDDDASKTNRKTNDGVQHRMLLNLVRIALST